MSQLNPILATLGKLQAHTAMMAQLTEAAPDDSVTLSRQDLHYAFSDIAQTVSAVYDDLASNDESHIDFDKACSDFEQVLSEAAPVFSMTEPRIISRSELEKVNGKTHDITRYFYIPSIPVSKTQRMTTVAFYREYGVELPAYYQDIDVSRFTEKTYYDENGDQQRVLVPLFKIRRKGEHTQAFYQRVGLLLPPID